MHIVPLHPPAEEGFTLEDLRKIKAFENVSDEEGNYIVATLCRFCEIVYSVYCRQNSLDCTDHYLQAA